MSKAKGEAFVKLPRDLLESTAWRSLSIHARRLIDFLLIEHMRHGGRENGRLLAPRRQFEAFGIAPEFCLCGDRGGRARRPHRLQTRRGPRAKHLRADLAAAR